MIPLNIMKTTVEIGLKEPVRLYHVTDAHICKAYENEGEELNWLAYNRWKNCFDHDLTGEPERVFERIVAYGKEKRCLFAFTGDIYDFISQANLDYFADLVKDIDYIYAAGNHDFCHFPGRDKEDYPYKLEYLHVLAPYVKDNLLFSSRVVGGVNLITLDNSYNQVTDGQTDALMAEAAKGLPMILFVHNPFYEKGYVEQTLAKGKDCAYVVAPPEEVLARYNPGRAASERATPATQRAYDYITSEPLIKAVFAGHTHENYQAPLPGGAVQYITGCAIDGHAREITVM